jgi:hypothetical protein
VGGADEADSRAERETGGTASGCRTTVQQVAEADKTDPDALLREVYATFGLALHRAQDIENSIVNLLIWAEVGDGRYRAFEESEVANARLFRQTLGAVSNRLVKRLPIVGYLKLDELLIRAVHLRNFLAHEYFRQRTIALLFADSQKQMIDELKSAVTFLDEVGSLIEMVTNEEFAVYMEGYPDITEQTWKRGSGDPLPGL